MRGRMHLSASCVSQHLLRQRLRQPPRPALGVDHRDDHLRRDQQRFAAADFLLEHHFRATGLFRTRHDRQDIVHARRALEVDFHAMDDEDEPLLVGADQLTLLDAEAAQIVGAAALEEMQISGMIDEAGEIGVFVIDTLDQPVSRFRQLARNRKSRYPP